jgi:hypothetical protein
MNERTRFDWRVHIAAYEFTRAMESHGIGGEANYYATEMMVFWPALWCYDQEHCWLLN